MEPPVNACFSEEQAGQALGELLACSQRVYEAMQTEWDQYGLGNRMDAIVKAEETRDRFIVTLRPLLPEGNTLSFSDTQRIYPILGQLLEGKAAADGSASWGLIIQACCASDRNLVPEDEVKIHQQIDSHLEQKRALLSFVETLDKVPAKFAVVVDRLRRPPLAQTATPIHILCMIAVMSEEARCQDQKTE